MGHDEDVAGDVVSGLVVQDGVIVAVAEVAYGGPSMGAISLDWYGTEMDRGGGQPLAGGAEEPPGEGRRAWLEVVASLALGS